ncbi:hypothetical protein GIB67_004619 [Kingdonia uniflora]|uniref:Filament-like plant protein n=1 Tax=Kingdonia uniflora TaxID=39325 RepID=A0A7J7MDC4_9MAGN|nr:hypothetical protein GIB67_004619 [Kingdonia uniflora]
MDRKSWPWKRKSSEKNSGETESSGSISSHSERYSDDQEASKRSSNHNSQSPEVTSKVKNSGEEVVSGSVKSEASRGSPNQNSQSPEVTSKVRTSVEEVVSETVKNLREKLSAALLNISAKEDLVKQHSKVAEEAVSGWEKAEKEVETLKDQLEAAIQKNSVLENRVGRLDGALKECVRQLNQGRVEEEQKIHDAVAKKTHELESIKLELENQLFELHTQVDAAKADLDLRPIFETVEKENTVLKLELLARVEDLEIATLERDLSVEAAETASKQHLESIKKVAKLEAECRRLRATARKASSFNDQKSITTSSACVESLADSQSDCGERLLTLDTDMQKLSNLEFNGCEPSCSDSWASALILELDQFKNEKSVRNLGSSSSVEIDFMHDFLEQERFVALQEKKKVVSDQPSDADLETKLKLKAMIERTSELEEKLEKVEAEKVELEVALAESQDRLETSQNQLSQAEEKLLELQRHLNLAFESKLTSEVELVALNAKREAVESELVSVDAEVRSLRAKVVSLETEVQAEQALSAEITAKCRKLEDELSKRKLEMELRRSTSLNGELKIKQDKELAVAAGKLAECQNTMASLGRQLRSLASLEDFMMDSDKPLEMTSGGVSPIPMSGEEMWTLHSNNTFLPKKELHTPKVNSSDSSGPSMNGKDEESPQSHSSSSSTSSVSHAMVGSEKTKKGFGKLFARNKSSS